MNDDYRRQLLTILAQLDQMSSEAEAILSRQADGEILPLTEALCELLADMRAAVEAKLEQAAEK